MTRGGWAIQHRTDTTVTFARDEGADAVLGCVLMFLFILPGLLYLLLANRTARVTVATYPYEGGPRVVTGGNADQYIGELAAWVREMPEEPTPRLTLEGNTPQGPPIAQKLRELAEARDAGLITQ